ncbi:MAG: N-6 DNA methylase [Mycoplasmataceae bacterium CE_OT135]|nr:MAG: N-6 DNA methylase [Mycoplasmataceae bacterium CE_OT135]KLL04338.1 MAG: N-6 DNA methylase [Mycoplasmataceae bacterium CE_OT135]
MSFLPMEDCQEHHLYAEPTKTKKIEEVYQGYTYFVENDLLIAKITPCFENGKMSIAKNLMNGIGFGSTEFVVLRAKKGVLIEWVYYCLRNSNFLEKGKLAMTGTTGRQRLKQEFVENYLITLPSLEIQEEFVKELEEEQQIINYQKQSINLLRKKEKRVLSGLWGND